MEQDDGNTAPDWEIVDSHHVRLRAERSGRGNGRVYTITITCTDGSGNSTQQERDGHSASELEQILN